MVERNTKISPGYQHYFSLGKIIHLKFLNLIFGKDRIGLATTRFHFLFSEPQAE